MDKIIEIKVAYPKSRIDELRRVFSVPEKHTDERLLEVLVGNVIDRYLSSEYFLPEDVQNLLIDNIDEKWL